NDTPLHNAAADHLSLIGQTRVHYIILQYPFSTLTGQIHFQRWVVILSQILEPIWEHTA
ncbi:16550_t:CDS:1, partial [Racocetra persica]